MAVWVLWQFGMGWWFASQMSYLFLALMAGIICLRWNQIASMWGRGGRYSSPIPVIPTRPFRRRVTLVLVALHLLAFFVLIRFAAIPLLNYDVLSYHVPLGQQFSASDHGQAALRQPGNFYSFMPLAGPMLEAPFVTGNDAAHGAGLQFFLIASLLFGAISCARCAAWLGARREGQWLASLLFLWHPMLLGSFLNALVEPLLALMTVAALEFLLAAGSRSGRFDTALAGGLCAGTAVAIKFSALGTAAIPIFVLAAVFLWGLRARPARFRFLLAAGIITGFLIATGPWFARAIWLGGHPFFPFGGESSDWTSTQAQFVVEQHRPQTPLDGQYWHDAARKNTAFGYTLGGALPVSLLLLAALVAPWLSRLRVPTRTGLGVSATRGTMLALLAVALVGYASFLTVRLNPERFLVPSVVLLLPAVAAGIAGRVAPGLNRLLPFTVLLVAAFFSFLPHLSTAVLFEGSYRVDERRAMVEPDPERARVLTMAAREAEVGKLLLLFEARAALFPGQVMYQTVWDRPAWTEDLKQSADADEFARRLAEHGITGVFVNEAEWGRLLDFYARQWLSDPASPRFGRLGIWESPQEEVMEGLRAFPPHRFAEFSERDLTILHDFLINLRRQARAAAPAGPVSEYWFVPLGS